jgi:enoyl-CoA hydratase
MADLERRLHHNVTILTLNRPERRNAYSPQMMAALGASFKECEHDPETAVIVLTGSGDKAFCAGMDLKAFSEGTMGSPQSYPQDFTNFLRTPYPKPVIAAVNGAAVGGGFELMLACDLVVAADHARFGIPEVKRGLCAGLGGTLLSARIPLGLALELGLTGELITAHRAKEMGIVNRVVAPDRVLEEALALAVTIAANGSLAVRATKQLMYEAFREGVAGGWRCLDELIPAVNASNDANEGARAFIEKRPPHWTGT